MQFGLWRVAAFVSSPIHLFCVRNQFLLQVYYALCQGWQFSIAKKYFCQDSFPMEKKRFFSWKKTQFFHQFEKTCQPCSLNLMRFRLSCSSSASILIFSTAHHLNCLNTTKNPTFTLTHTWTHVLLNTGRWGLQEVSVQLKSISKSHSTSL